MQQAEHIDTATNVLARRALFVTLSLAMTGSGIGLVAAHFGKVTGAELVLVCCSITYSFGALFALLVFRRVALQTIATLSTIFFVINLCAGAVITVCMNVEHFGLFVYLVWFFPLLVFNKLINNPRAGRILTRIIVAAPLLTTACLLPWIMRDFKTEYLIVLAVYCFAYASFGTMFKSVTNYREEYIVERERAEAHKLEAEVLESISDCFISLDSWSKLIYLNDAACTEFGVERSAALQHTLSHAAPGFFSHDMRNGMETASGLYTASNFEAQNKARDIWYAMRCYPRTDSMSVHFRNITESVALRETVEASNNTMREQAELIDKASDAILVVDMDVRITYWNKSAERLYGWTSEEVMGRLASEIFRYDLDALNARSASVLHNGEWFGELSQARRDGSLVTVESHCTLVRDKKGAPHSVLAINTDISKRKEAEARIEYLAYYDVLTELPNRQLLQERVTNALAKAALNASMGAILFIDLDDFKTLNNTRGHETGDLLLQQVALRLIGCMRPGDTVARFAGDEFVVLLEGLSDNAEAAAAEAVAVANIILGTFHQPYKMGSFENDSTCSIGITLFPESADATDDLLKRAELAMHRAKLQGRNTMCFFDPTMQTQVDSRAELRSDLRHALHNRQFELHYQPQMDSAGRVTGAESLLRWRHPRRGMVPPNEFIPLAEEAGLIVELGRWVLETACTQLAAWSSRPGMETLSVAVNVSVRQFLDANFVTLVGEVLQEFGVNPNRLKLEITESSVMEKVDEVIAKMASLNALGVSFSLDDFGTGYSSLSHLTRLPLHQLKIDRSFVTGVVSDDRNASIARTIITLGRNLHLSVIAEGVETEEQRAFLEQEGCHAYQGYLYSPALPAEKFEAFVAQFDRSAFSRSSGVSRNRLN